MAETWKKLAFEDDVVLKALFDAQSVLAATVDNTPAALVVAEQEVVGRLSGGNVDGIALGIADNNIVQIDSADAGADEYAVFTANGLKGLTTAEVVAALSLVDISGTPEANDIARFTDADTIEGRSYTEFKADLDLEIGTDILAEQAIGIGDDNLVEVDAADVADDDYARFTVNGLEGRSFAEVLSDIGAQATDAGLTSLAGLGYASASMIKMTAEDTYATRTLAEVMTDLSGTAGAAFDWNGQQLQNMLLHIVADDAAKTALSSALAMVVWQTDDACVYVCTEAEV